GTLWPAAHADDPKPAAKAADPAAKPETPAATPAADDRIRPGDRLRIIAGGGSLTEPPATGVIVEPSGQVPLGGWYGRVKVAGLTPEEAEAAIVEHLKKWHGGEGQWAQVVRWGQFPIDPGAPGVGLLEDRVRKLEQEVAELKKAVDELRKK
ncbi:MAG: polysaccharide biosynthesis/export family protein, partial [Gemmataceae bacterium]|nr:polysaccharide biosynthesis/export family protein [Gemmataceae bacterium]